MDKKIMPSHEGLHPSVLIVEIDNSTVYLLEDRISNVSHLSDDNIDTIQAVISFYGKEYKGFVKLNTDIQVILLVDETLTRYSEEMAAIFFLQEKHTKTIILSSDFVFPSADFICIRQGACENGMVHGNLFIKKKRQPAFQAGLAITSKSPPSTHGFPWTPCRGRPAPFKINLTV